MPEYACYVFRNQPGEKEHKCSRELRGKYRCRNIISEKALSVGGDFLGHKRILEQNTPWKEAPHTSI